MFTLLIFIKSRAESGRFRLVCFVQISRAVLRKGQIVVWPIILRRNVWDMTKKENDNIGKAFLKNFY